MNTKTPELNEDQAILHCLAAGMATLLREVSEADHDDTDVAAHAVLSREQTAAYNVQQARYRNAVERAERVITRIRTAIDDANFRDTIMATAKEGRTIAQAYNTLLSLKALLTEIEEPEDKS